MEIYTDVVARGHKGEAVPFLKARLDDGDAAACPFCGSTDVRLANTWTPSYWVECDCGAKMDGRDASELGNFRNSDHNQDAHLAAANDALREWNCRSVP